MGPVATAVPPSPVPAGKAKKPIPPGIQTNGAGPSPSPSPTMTTKKAPNSAKAASIPPPPTPNGTGGQAQKAPQNRPRREASAQLSRTSRNSVSLRASSVADEMIAQASKPPGSKTSREILKTFVGNPPSIIVHLHPTNFRFDQQDGAFSYTSPMKVFLEHIRNRTVPHELDLLRGLHSSGVPFYEGCLIVQVHDHKSVAQANNTPKAAAKTNTATISSIHNYNPYLTPSTTNYPKTEPQPVADADAGAGGQSVEKKVEEHNKENILSPPLPTNPKTTPRKPTITTVVLHPTQQSLLAELLIKASTPSATADGKDDPLAPPTPATAAPSSTNKTPRPAKRQKREPMEIDGSNINAVEGQILLHTLPPLDLEPARNKEDVIALLEKHEKEQPMHSEPLPKPKARKRTVAEMAADQALIAGQERYMLTLDERLGPAVNGAQGASAGGDGDMRGGGAAFEPGFERLRVIMDIKREHAERAEKERLQQVENQKRLEQQRQQQQQQEQQAALQRQQEAERLRKEALQRDMLARRQQQEEAQRKAQQAQAQAQAAKLKQQQQQAKNLAQAQNANAAKAAAAAKAKATAAAAAAANANANANANAVSSGPLANGIQSAQAAQRFHQQVAQPQASSPAVRQGTPHSMSSPMVSGVAMQPSNSNMAGSPPRPPSAMQTHTPMAVAMSHSMSARGSQQSHPAGTPRMPNGTPNMAHTTPINRPASLQTPRMSQASPPPPMAAQGSQMGQLMGNPAVSQQMLQQNAIAQQLAVQQQQLAAQQKRMLAQQHLGQPIQNGMMNGMNGMNPQNLTPQQQQQLQQHRLQQILMQQQQQQLQQQMQQQQNQLHPQQQQQQQQRAGMMNPLAQQYAQSMSQMQGQLSPQMQAQLQAQMARMNHANQMNQNGGNQMGRPMMPNQAMMNNGDPASMQAALVQMQQMQQQQQQAVQQSQQQQMQQQLQARGQHLYKVNFAKFAAQFGGAMENIPAEALEKFKKDCMLQARTNLLQMQQARQQQAQAQLQAQHHMAMQQPQGMMGGHQGM
ncbi:uncharacterized protein DNG_06660 [Cephalotrichum gorgonifer]|uniref:Spt20-like SEP domain-containing protein n=1 Tax=Cephalotrichum gorgonifer TaxID=2041049 RepID=A0AAE8SXI1_9PEZI|nr:uncharacterized protein DNG_06660 [Cephalotrichum gorgonifer]